jgi:predicted RNA-binding Zn-ribbon protein involved in translation (DUF1610 family)
MVRKGPGRERIMAAENCPNCGRETGARGHMCSPTEESRTAYECSHCGRTETDPRHICFPKLAEVKFSCANCGRVAVQGEDLCSPKEIQGGKKD